MKEYMNKDIVLTKEQKIGILASIIIVSGFVGWLYEFIFYFFNSGMKQFYMRGGNFLPWINIYAYGAILIILLTFKRRKYPLQVFLISFVVTGILEYLSGYILYDVLGQTRCWSYNEEILNFGNIGGFVCLRSVLIFGLSGLFLIYGILPFFIHLSKKVDAKKFMIVTVILCSIFLIDEIYNLIFTQLFHLPKASFLYKKLGFHYIYFKH